MKKCVWMLALALALMIVTCVRADEPIQADVDGNATVFSFDEQSGKLRLADSRVMGVVAIHSGWSVFQPPILEDPRPWDVSPDYRNAQAVQALFDEMLAAEPVEGKYAPHSNAGLTILAAPPGDTSRFAHIELTPAIRSNEEPCTDVVSVSLRVYQVMSGKTFYDFHLRSAKLWEQVVAMSASHGSLKDAKDAVAAMMCATPYPLFLDPDPNSAQTEDSQAISRIVDVLLKAMPMEQTDIEYYDGQQLLLWLRDGRRMNVYVGGGFYWDDRDLQTQRYRRFIRVGEQRYEIDAAALQDALRDGGLALMEMPDGFAEYAGD